MPPVHPWASSFTTGEVTPQLLARVDWDRFKNAAGNLTNFVCRPYGGVARRAGLSYVGAAADQDARCYLIDFRVSETVAYVCEFSDLSLRIWREREPVPGATLASPYEVGDLRALRTAQSADVMYLCHPDYPPHKLVRTSPTTFTLSAVQFDAPPTVEIGITPLTGLTLSATTGSSVTVTAGAAYWNDGDPGRHIRAGTGVGVITDVTSPTTATLHVLEPFASTTLAAGAWTLEDSPQVSLAVMYQDPVLGLAMDAGGAVGVNILANATVPGAATGTPFWTQSDVGLHIREVGSGTGSAIIESLDSSTYIRLTIDTAFSSGSLPPGNWEIEGSSKGAYQPLVHIRVKDGFSGFHPEEQSGYLRLLGGVVEIQTATATEVTGRLVAPFTPDVRLISPPGAWSREVSAWDDDRGYPGCCAFNQSRLWFAGSPAQPDTIWGSVTGDYEVFALGPDDDDAVEYALAVSSGMNLIRWVKGMAAGSTTGLAIGTSAAEISLEGGQEAPLTPSNVRARERTYYGCDFTVDAITTNNLVLFLQRGGRRIREFTYALEQDAFVAPDLTLTAEHLTRAGIVEMVHANSPDSLIFALTADGVLLACAYERPEAVVAWTHHVTQGVFESVCVIPNHCGTGDELWVAVARTLDGEVRRSIEVFDGRLNTDAALVYEGVATGNFTGLTHLAGATVKAIDQEDTVYDLVVDGSGEVTLPGGASATRLEVGLHYTSTLETLRPELAGPQGTIQARRKHWSYTIARLYCTKSRLLWNGEFLLELPEGTPAGDYTGDSARVTNLGWSREGILTLQTLDPLPATVLGISGALSVDDA
jgi:hypothetical protein